MKTYLKLGLFVCICSLAVQAADIAVLHNGFTIRHERREVLGQVTRLYPDNAGASFVDIPTAEIDHFEQDLTPSTPAVETVPSSATAKPIKAPTTHNIDDIVNSASDQQNVDPDLINSVIHAESGFNPKAVSPKGARGLMQLMPQTATQLGVTNSFDPSANVDGGTKYLRELLERYNFDMVKALAAYNAGPQRVDRYHGVPPYYETQAYIARIVRDFNRKKLAEKKAAAQSQKLASAKKRKPRSAQSPGSSPARSNALAASNTASPATARGN